MREYTLVEIDQMRDDLEYILYETRALWPHEVTQKAVEGRLRTYLAAGIRPEELKAKADALRAKYNRV